MADYELSPVQRQLDEFTDPNGWLANAYRSILGRAKMPIDAGADALRNLSAFALGGTLRDPTKYTNATDEEVKRATNATITPVVSAMQRARQAGLEALGAQPFEGESNTGVTPNVGGALPTAGAFPDYPRTTSLPVASPTRRSSRPALAPQTPPALSPMEFQGMPPAAEPEQMPNLSPAEFQGMPPATPAAAPRQSYVDMFKEMLAQKQEPLKAPLTEEQQRDLKLKFYLGLMNQPRGTGLIQGAGAAGEQALAAKQGLLKENMTQAEKARAVQMETANKLLGVRNLEDDNAARERQLGITEKHYGDQASHNKRLEDLKQKELEIMQKYREGQYETAKERAEAAGRLADIKGQMATLRGQVAQMDPIGRHFNAIMGLSDKYGLDVDPKDILKGLMPNRASSTFDEQDIANMYRDAVKENAKSLDQQPMPSFAQFKSRVLGGVQSPQSFASDAEIKSAMKSGKVKAGDVVIVNGKKFKVSE